MKQEEATTKYQTEWWKGKTNKEIVDFQLYEEYLCMPFSDFHKAVEAVLKRPVFTHEFADSKSLKAEYEGKRAYKGLEESIKRIIPQKPVIIVET